MYPGLNASVIVFNIAGVSVEMRQVTRKMHSMLPGTTAYLQHRFAVSKCPRQLSQYRLFVVFAGLAKRLSHSDWDPTSAEQFRYPTLCAWHNLQPDPVGFSLPQNNGLPDAQNTSPTLTRQATLHSFR